MSTSSSPQLVRHVIYFPDGDVAVASTKASDDEGKIIHVFCIHTSTIASHSTHFADDLREKARSPSIDSYSGIPLVRYSDETKFLESLFGFVYYGITEPPRFSYANLETKLLTQFMVMARKYKFDGLMAKCIIVLEKDWPTTLSGLYRAHAEMKQLQVNPRKASNLDNEDDIDDPDLKRETPERIQPRKFDDVDIKSAAWAALVHATTFKIPSIFPAAFYTLYVQTNFRTVRRFLHGQGPKNVRHMMTNELDKLTKILPVDISPIVQVMKKFVYIVSFWIQKKFKRLCCDCARVEKKRAGDLDDEMDIDVGPVKFPLPPFVDLRVCEPDPLGNLRLETIKYFRKYRPTDKKYCQKCWMVMKQDINAWADKLWVEVLTKGDITHNYIMDDVMLDGASMNWPEEGPEVVPHKTIYFPDGDVALQSTAIPQSGNSFVYRVHASVLAKDSRQFASQLRRTLGTTVCYEYDGVPLIALPDPPEHLEAILNLVYFGLELPPRFNSDGYKDKFWRILGMAQKYQFDAVRTKVVEFLEKDWPPKLEDLYRVQAEIKQLQVTVENVAGLGGVIDDPDLMGAPYQAPSNRLTDEEIDRAAAMALLLSTKYKIPSIQAAAIYRLYAQAKFRTPYRLTGHADADVIRAVMTNKLSELTDHLADIALPKSMLVGISTAVSFWVEKKLQRRCSDCHAAERKRAEAKASRKAQKRAQGDVEAEEDMVPVRKPLPPFANLHSCESDPLVLVHSEKAKYYLRYRPRDSNSEYCSQCWDVLKKEIDAWAARLWDKVFTNGEIAPDAIVKEVLNHDNDGLIDVQVLLDDAMEEVVPPSLTQQMDKLSMMNPLGTPSVSFLHATSRNHIRKVFGPGRSPGLPFHMFPQFMAMVDSYSSFRPSSRPSAPQPARPTEASQSSTTQPKATNTSRAQETRPAGAPRPTGFWAPSPSPEASGSSQVPPDETSRSTGDRPIAPLPKRALRKTTPDQDEPMEFEESAYLAAASGRPVINLDPYAPEEQPVETEAEAMDSDEDLYGGAPLRERSIPPEAWDDY